MTDSELILVFLWTLKLVFILAWSAFEETYIELERDIPNNEKKIPTEAVTQCQKYQCNYNYVPISIWIVSLHREVSAL